MIPIAFRPLQKQLCSVIVTSAPLMHQSGDSTHFIDSLESKTLISPISSEFFT